MLLIMLSTGGITACGNAEEATPSHMARGATRPPQGVTEYVNHHYAYRVNLPAGWSRAHTSLTPSLDDPREILTVATFPLRLHRGSCAQFPGALTDVRPRDVLVTVQERAGKPTPEFVRRPQHFTAGMGFRSEASACVRPPARFSNRLINFRDGPRFFHALVAIGKSASSQTRREAFEILDSLRFGRFRPRWHSTG